MGEQGTSQATTLRDIYFHVHMFAHTVGREGAFCGALNSLSPTWPPYSDTMLSTTVCAHIDSLTAGEFLDELPIRPL